MAVVVPEIAALVDRLRSLFAPEEIILFGSQANGAARPDSDADLLVVLPQTSEPYRERQARGERAVNQPHGIAAHIFPHTAPELHTQLAKGNSAVRDALAQGVLLYPSGTKSRYAEWSKEWNRMAAVDDWLGRARDDLSLATVGMPTGAYWGVAFHAQQAAEKALKALIYHLGGEPNRTHNLTSLFQDAVLLNAAVSGPLAARHRQIGDFSRFAVETRYPGDAAVTEETARSALEAARAFVHEVAAIIGR